MYALQWQLNHLQLKLDGGGTIVEVADEAEHFLVHRHEDRSGEGALMCVLDGDGLVGLFIVVGYLEAHGDDFDD